VAPAIYLIALVVSIGSFAAAKQTVGWNPMATYFKPAQRAFYRQSVDSIHRRPKMPGGFALHRQLGHSE